jgi:hypothetical protein
MVCSGELVGDRQDRGVADREGLHRRGVLVDLGRQAGVGVLGSEGGAPSLAGRGPQPHVVALLAEDLLDPVDRVVVEQLRPAPCRFQGAQLLTVGAELLQHDGAHHVHVAERTPLGFAPAVSAATITSRHGTDHRRPARAGTR